VDAVGHGAATAASTSARPASCTWAMTSPWSGERLSKLRPVAWYSPLMKFRICFMVISYPARDDLHHPRVSVVVRIGMGRKASFCSQ